MLADAEAGQTDATVREKNLRLAKLGQENGLQIWVTDFATNEDTAKKSYELNPNNVWVTQLLSQLYQMSGNIDGELSAYKDLIEKDPSNIEYQFLLANAYLKESDADDKLERFKVLLISSSIDPLIPAEKSN